ncbi:MAG: hypothetical protein PVJ55_09715 [Anaerolineae bacterium]
MAIYKGCPGAITIKEPMPEYVDCPECGQETEIWSDERAGQCHHCGAALHQNIGPSCIEWCVQAEQCIGEEKYQRLMQPVSVA